MTDDEERLAVRRGAEHVRIKGTTEELGEIVPAPVETEDQSVTVQGKQGQREGREDREARDEGESDEGEGY
jgi:hypothetical protein